MSGRGNFRVRAEDTGWEGAGGYMVAKVRKLEDQFDQDVVTKTQTSAIFQGISILVDGWTDPSADELKMIMLKNGGKYHMYYSRTKTTHVIASNLPHAKRKELRPGQKVVKPQWITDSLKAKELLAIEEYLVVPVEDGAQNRITSLFGKVQSSATSEVKASCKICFIVDNFERPTSSTAMKRAQMLLKDVGAEEAAVNTSDSAVKMSHSICSTTDSNFLSEFYSHSRLHFLSTWKMELKEYVRSLQSAESLERVPLSGYQKLFEIAKLEVSDEINYGRAIMHIDMDCFFVSVGLKNHPELRGLPVAVTHSSGTGITSERSDTNPEYERNYYKKKYGDASKLCGTASSSRTSYSSAMFGPGFSASEIASCSYEARASGVKNGMFMGKAKQLCPELRVIPYDFEAYRQTSDLLYNTLASFTRHIEAVSCDEALVDITKLSQETGLSPIKVASIIRNAVKEATSCNASTGIGPNIALARMATKKAKPDGEFMVSQDEAKEFMSDLSLRDLPGVGRSTAFHLEELQIFNCGQLQNYPLSELKREFGLKTGQKLHDMSCGIDTREVEIEKERKSVSAEVNYGIRLADDDEAKTFLENLSREVTNRLKAIGMRGRRVTLKIMARKSDAPQESLKYGGHGICNSFSKTSIITLKNKGDIYEEDSVAIYESAWSILQSMHLKVSDLRGIGIQVTQLQSISKVKESSSASFLKKFIVKKVPMQNETVDTTLPIADPMSDHKDSVVSEVANCETLDESFLDALPPDIRKEVKENMVQQREALERNFLQNENSNDSHASSVIYIDESSRGSTSSCNLFFEQGKLPSTTKTSKASKKTRKTKGARSRGANAGTSKSTKRTRASDVSPNKLITDMFPVTYSPRKPRTSPNKLKSSSARLRKNVTAVPLEKAKKRLLASQESETIVLEDQQTDVLHHKTEQKDLPSLGGAYKIEDIRQALVEWVTAYEDEGPLDCDVDDFISFLCKTATEVRDLEKVHLTVRSFRRRLSIILEKKPFNSAWRNAFMHVCNQLQSAIRASYRGAELLIPPL